MSAARLRTAQKLGKSSRRVNWLFASWRQKGAGLKDAILYPSEFYPSELLELFSQKGYLKP